MQEPEIRIALEDWLRAVGDQRFPLPSSIDKLRRFESPLHRATVDPLPGHVGLWLDRCLIEPNVGAGQGDTRPGREFLYRMAMDALRVGAPGEESLALKQYRVMFARWERVLRQSLPGVVRRVYRMRATSRILLHPATQETVTEGGLLMHHLYGVPYIPGSALKGAVRAYAIARGMDIRPPGVPERLPDEITWIGHLFGLQRDEDNMNPDERPDTAGIFDFLDALWVPEVPSGVKGPFSPLSLDVVNPHYGDYYTNKKHPAPRETSEPVPSHVLTVAPGATFLLAVETREWAVGVFEKWLDWMMLNLLVPALGEIGIGARTTAGYGRLAVEGLSGRKEEVSEGASGPTRAMGWVSFIKGSGTLRATIQGESPAEVRGAAAKEMVDGLSDVPRVRLLKGKEVRLYVWWELAGNARQIVKIGEG